MIGRTDVEIAVGRQDHPVHRAGQEIPRGQVISEPDGNHVAVVDRWFASSKTCSGCGAIQESLSLGEREFRCAACGLTKDRDANAAMNLSHTVSSTGSQACGEERPGFGVSGSETILCEAGTWA